MDKGDSFRSELLKIWANHPQNGKLSMNENGVPPGTMQIWQSQPENGPPKRS